MPLVVKQTETMELMNEALEALMQEEWLEPMEQLKEEYQNISVPEEARYAVQKGIERAKAETGVRKTAFKRRERFYGMIAAMATAVATLFVFVVLNTNTQLAVTMAGIPGLKPMVEFMTGQEYHEDVYLNIKVAHLSGKEGTQTDALPPLSTLFVQDVDYVAVISEEIRRQMAQLPEYTMLLDTFTQISAEPIYYLNDDCELVIVLSDYEMAPEFIIEFAVLADILK